jgi:hypothetical protein
MSGTPSNETAAPSNTRAQRLETWIFAAFTGLLCLWVGRAFIGSMSDQLFLSDANHQRLAAASKWSAPLDDVFIHFDFARSTARGYPFEWSEGNGYSSGGTSLLYPFVLALGYRIGYQGTQLMHWAVIVATLSVWGFTYGTRVLTPTVAPWTRFVVPIILLSVGGLNWSLWSGMEVAFFLLVWTLCLLQWRALSDAPAGAHLAPATQLGLACALLVATRPESAILVALFAFTAIARPGISMRQRLSCLLLGGLPGFLILVSQAVANRVFTGEWSAAGGVVKLEVNHPFMTRVEMWEAWLSNVGYQVARITNHHFTTDYWPALGTQLSTGWLLWFLALVPLFFSATRRGAVLLWLSILCWMGTVALNGQVRWQNERYAMPAVAWLLLTAGIGAALLLSEASRQLSRNRRRMVAWALLGVPVAACTLFVWGGVAQYRNQVWFFGRAARNIWDQHVTAARKLRELDGHRVMVGDAGAIPYVSDLPALDFIGLGGYHDVPFARATRLGIAAGIELIQRLPDADRPDLMALYPSWWGDLPVWFGERLSTVSVAGNVICGGRDKVIYRPDFRPLIGTDKPTQTGRHTRVRAEVDFADIVSEKAAATRYVGTRGYVTMRMLPHPKDPSRDLWDAGRILAPGSDVTFQVSGLIPHQAATVLMRFVTAHPTQVELRLGGTRLSETVTPIGGWQEIPFELSAAQVQDSLELTLAANRDEVIIYHLWVLQER